MINVMECFDQVITGQTNVTNKGHHSVTLKNVMECFEFDQVITAQTNET